VKQKRHPSIVAEIAQGLCCADNVLLVTLVSHHSVVNWFVWCTSRTECHSQWVHGHADACRVQPTVCSYLWWHKQVHILYLWRIAVMPSVLWCCWLGDTKAIRTVKISVSEPLEMMVNINSSKYPVSTGHLSALKRICRVLAVIMVCEWAALYVVFLNVTIALSGGAELSSR